MILHVTMKDPDTLCDAIDRAVGEWVKGIEGIDNEEREAVAEARKEKVREVCGQWFEYGEYLTVEIDTEDKTATVVRR